MSIIPPVNAERKVAIADLTVKYRSKESIFKHGVLFL
jgi:hypothetical protein